MQLPSRDVVRRWMSLNALLYVIYLPRIIATLKNWIRYLQKYLGYGQGKSDFRFRNGLRIGDRQGTAAGTIAVIFIRRCYGDPISNKIIVDIGANIGVFTVFAASRSKEAKIYSYEPVKSNFDILVENIAENGLKERCIPHNIGIAAKRGKREIFISTSPSHSIVSNAGSLCKAMVDCISMEDLVDDNEIVTIDFLKMNCEGAEYEILYSSKNVLKHVENIRLEYHNYAKDGYNSKTLCEFLKSCQFSIVRNVKNTNRDGFIWARSTRL